MMSLSGRLYKKHWRVRRPKVVGTYFRADDELKVPHVSLLHSLCYLPDCFSTYSVGTSVNFNIIKTEF